MTPLLALVALLLGVFATLVTPREEEPQIDVTMADVLIAFPGASAKDVENLVARPAEQVLSRMHGVEHVYSMSRPGMAVITVQFDVGVKYNDAVLRLYDTVHSHRDWLPPNLGVQEPVIKPRGIDDVPIVGLTFWTKDPERSAYELQQVARAVEIELKRIKGTRDVSTLGGPDHAIRVLMDSRADERLRRHAAGYRRRAQGVQRPAILGQPDRRQSRSTGPDRHLSRIRRRRKATGRCRARRAGSRKPIFMSDVARSKTAPTSPSATPGLAARTANSRLSPSNFQAAGRQCRRCGKCYGRPDKSLKNTVIPEGVEVTVTRNYGETATEKAQKLIGKLIFATAFVVALVFFALGRREAVIVGVAVTLTLAATLFASWAWGFTLNRVSLFALIFSIGILVDDAIVVVENIHRWQPCTPTSRCSKSSRRPSMKSAGRPSWPPDRDRRAAADGLRHRPDGAIHEPDPDQLLDGHGISLAVAFVVTPWLALKLMKTHGRARGISHRSSTPSSTAPSASC
jgi:hypothetical protein